MKNLSFKEILNQKLLAANEPPTEPQNLGLYAISGLELDSLVAQIKTPIQTVKHRSQAQYKSTDKPTEKPIDKPIDKHTEQKKTHQKPEKFFELDKLSTASRIGLLALDLELNIEKNETGRTLKISVTQLKRAFRKKARSLHPDLNPSMADSHFSNLKEIYEQITNEVRKLTASCDT